MTLSTRISIQWPPEPPKEETHTMVFTSPQNHFVDVRILKDKYPYKKIDLDPFIDEVFQWCMTGVEVTIPNTNKIKFDHNIDSQAISKSIRLNKPIEECMGEPDIGDFSPIDGSKDRKETGKMVNPATGSKCSYVEIWRSLDPLGENPLVEDRESANQSKPEVFVLQTSSGLYEGKLIRLGNWIQGIVYDKVDKKLPLHVIRSHYNKSTSKWENMIEYGNINWFPIEFKGLLNESVATTYNMIWKCIER